MACAFTHDIFEMITMIAELRTACWSSDQAAARKLETPTARHWHGHRSLRSSKRGGRGSFAMLPRHYEPTGAPSHALWANIRGSHTPMMEAMPKPNSQWRRRRCVCALVDVHLQLCMEYIVYRPIAIYSRRPVHGIYIYSDRYTVDVAFGFL